MARFSILNRVFLIPTMNSIHIFLFSSVLLLALLPNNDVSVNIDLESYLPSILLVLTEKTEFRS